MISIVGLWEAVSRTGKFGTAGYQDEDQFNIDIKSCQFALMSALAPLNSTNQVAKDLLGPFIVPFSGSTDAQGVIAKPSDYYQMDSLITNGYPVYPIETNELALLQFIPSRRPSLTDNRYFFYMRNDEINVVPSAVHPLSGTYIREPSEAKIILTPTSTEDSDYVTPTSGGDLEWNNRVFNIFLYMMLHRMGFEIEKQLVMEFAQIGVQLEMSNFNG